MENRQNKNLGHFLWRWTGLGITMSVRHGYGHRIQFLFSLVIFMLIALRRAAGTHAVFPKKAPTTLIFTLLRAVYETVILNDGDSSITHKEIERALRYCIEALPANGSVVVKYKKRCGNLSYHTSYQYNQRLFKKVSHQHRAFRKV